MLYNGMGLGGCMENKRMCGDVYVGGVCVGV